MPAKFCGFTKYLNCNFCKILRIFKEEEKKRNSWIIYLSTMLLVCYQNQVEKCMWKGYFIKYYSKDKELLHLYFIFTLWKNVCPGTLSWALTNNHSILSQLSKTVYAGLSSRLWIFTFLLTIMFYVGNEYNRNR